ncbi:MAG: hypothetical protein JXQ73_09155 [Phycisphaerae bacterium]|nr:hypothetical protein [Phycisphaerae bacterium]
MNDPSDTIIQEIRRDERWLADLLAATPLPPRDALARTRQVVAIELDRSVMERHGQPTPDAETIRRTKAAVQAELRGANVGRWSRRTARRVGLTASAAAIALVVGLLRWMPSAQTPDSKDIETSGPGGPSVALRPAEPRAPDPVAQIVDDMTSAFESVADRRDPALAILADDIDLMTTPSLESSVEPVDSALDEIGEQIETLFADQEASWET